MNGWHVAVVIPAHNEADTIAGCIDSIFRAAEHDLRLNGLWVVVAADACTDATVRLAREALAGRGEVIGLEARRAGEARRVGTEAALRHFSAVARDQLWVSCTDADSSVRADWLQVQLAAADAGYQGLAGIIELMDGAAHVRGVHQQAYAINADGSHTHVHGANLGFRADAYLDAGGWRDLALAEDHCLWRRLKARGWRLVSSASSVVLTSARLAGRADGGFASTLRARLQSDAASAVSGASATAGLRLQWAPGAR